MSKNKIASIGLCFVLIVLPSCSGALPSQPTTDLNLPTVPGVGPEVTDALVAVNDTSQPLASSVPTPIGGTTFIDLSDCPLDDSGRNVCPTDSLLGRLGCEWVAPPEGDLSGLDPSYPITVCWSLGRPDQRLPAEEYIFRRGCMLPQYARYVIQQDGQFVLLGNLAALQNTFAPITSAPEALSYAVAATDFEQITSFEAPPNYRFFVDKVENSRAVQTDQGYQVNLYDYRFCGCGPHTTFAVEVLIKPDGSIAEAGRTPAFENPEQDALCVD